MLFTMRVLVDTIIHSKPVVSLWFCKSSLVVQRMAGAAHAVYRSHFDCPRIHAP